MDNVGRGRGGEALVVVAGAVAVGRVQKLVKQNHINVHIAS